MTQQTKKITTLGLVTLHSLHYNLLLACGCAKITKLNSTRNTYKQTDRHIDRQTDILLFPYGRIWYTKGIRYIMFGLVATDTIHNRQFQIWKSLDTCWIDPLKIGNQYYGKMLFLFFYVIFGHPLKIGNQYYGKMLI